MFYISIIKYPINQKIMNAVSNNWKPEMLSSGSAGDDSSMYSSAYDVEQEELTSHIADKKTKKIGRMVEAMVILFVLAIAVFAAYKVFSSI
jgi:hypothetical protein